MTEWTPGMVYDIGGASALFWPDQHPEHPDPALAQRWIVFDPWGGMEIIVGRPPREDAPITREIGLMPFLIPEGLGRYVFGTKEQLLALNAHLFTRLDDARQRYVEEVRAVFGSALDAEFPKSE
jgi:hypothetical protein